MKPVRQSLIDQCQWVPFFISYGFTSLSEAMDDFCVVECESNHRYFNRHFISFWAIHAQRWESRQSPFHFVLDVQPELSNLWYRICRIVKSRNKSLIHWLRNIKFNWIISRSDSFDIPIYEFMSFGTSLIVDENEDKEVHEDGKDAHKEAHHLPHRQSFSRNQARHLKEKICVLIAGLCSFGIIMEWSEIDRGEVDLASSFAMAFVLDWQGQFIALAAWYGGCAIMMPTFDDVLLKGSGMARCEPCKFSRDEPKYSTFTIQDIGWWAEHIDKTLTYSTLSTCRCWCASISYEKLRHWLHSISFEGPASTIDPEDRESTYRNSNEHHWYRGQVLKVWVDAIARRHIRVVYCIHFTGWNFQL